MTTKLEDLSKTTFDTDKFQKNESLTCRIDERMPPPCRRGHTEGPHHDCGYVDAVNALIDGAMMSARVRLQDYIEEFGMPDDTEADTILTRLFHEEMQVACEVEGLRKPTGR